VPPALLPWLTEPGLLTARVRAACGDAMTLNLLRVAPAPLSRALADRLGVHDRGCLHREIELCCGGTRWIYARSVFPDSTVREHPWLAELGGNGLGETLSKVTDVQRDPIEYLELPAGNDLAIAATGGSAVRGPLWARRKLYRLAGGPILVQEVFLPVPYVA
jgi:chorismate lyase